MSTADLERAVAALVESEKAAADARVAARKAAQALDTAVAVDAAEQRASAVAGITSDDEWQQAMLEAALGHRWFNGGDEGDSIMEHQWEGMLFGAGAERFILGDGMGLGKTRTTVGWLDLSAARKVVIVCLAEVAPQFAGELEELAPHRRVVLLTGRTPAARQREMDAIEHFDEATVVVNFELFGRKSEVLDRLIAWHADTVVVDEAHQIKAPAAKKNLERLVLEVNTDDTPVSDAPLDRLLARRSVKRVALVTGTPILNEPSDIFPLLHLVDPLLFKSLAAFKRAYVNTNHASGRDEFKPGGLWRLKQLLAGFYIARTYEDAGVTLPKNTHRVIPVPVDREQYPDQRRVIDEITGAARITLASGAVHDIMHLLSIVLRKRQANVWPAGIEIVDTNPDSPSYGEVLFAVGDDVQESAKLDAVIREIEARPDERQVVFSQFKTGLAELERRLVAQGHRVARLDGGTDRRRRTEIREDFGRGSVARGEHRWDVLLANYKTGGVGLNLQGATVVHELDEEWNPGKRDQARARSHRVGQTRETTTLTYRVPASVDTYMANIVRGKERMVNGFNDVVLDRMSIEDQLKEAIGA